MTSWWDLGEGSGFSGEKLATYRIACAFCGEKGNFATAQHLERQKPGEAFRIERRMVELFGMTRYNPLGDGGAAVLPEAGRAWGRGHPHCFPC